MTAQQLAALGLQQLQSSLEIVVRRVMTHSNFSIFPPPWTDAYLDELLVRAAAVQFWQVPPPSTEPLVQLPSAKWDNIAVLLRKTRAACILRYIQLCIMRARVNVTGEIRTAKMCVNEAVSASHSVLAGGVVLPVQVAGENSNEFGAVLGSPTVLGAKLNEALSGIRRRVYRFLRISWNFQRR